MPRPIHVPLGFERVLGQQEIVADVAATPAGLEVFQDDKLLLAATYWGLIRGSKAVPRRADLDPGAMPPDILPWIVLIMCEGARLRYRLVGTGLRELLGRDLTGTYVDEMTPNPDYNHYMEGHLRRVLDTGSCLYTQTVIQIGGEPKRTERFMAPLSKSGTETDMIFLCQSFESNPRSLPGVKSTLGKGPHMMRKPHVNDVSYTHICDRYLDF